MRKRKLILLTCALCACATFACSFAGCAPKFPKEAVEKPTSITVGSSRGGNIRVMQLTDLHLTKGSSFKQDKQTLRWTKEAVRFAHADVVAVTGDLVGSLYGRDRALKEFADIMEEEKQYWMYTFGNHDAEWSHSTKKTEPIDSVAEREYMLDLLKGYKYSLMQKGSTDGVGNYLVDMVDKDGNIIYSFVNMDSHGKKFDEKGSDIGYYGVHSAQVEWYDQQIAALKERSNNQKIQSALFMHVPFYEYNTALAQTPHVGNFTEHFLENRCYSPSEKDDTGLFGKIVEKQSTSFVSVGHDHDFNWLREYNDIYLSYGRVSGVNAWERRTPVGATIVDINPKATSLELMYRVGVIEPSFAYSQFSGF
ncbi:MAG: metallophosphoesterase [Clostridia bacterium]